MRNNIDNVGKFIRLLHKRFDMSGIDIMRDECFSGFADIGVLHIEGGYNELEKIQDWFARRKRLFSSVPSYVYYMHLCSFGKELLVYIRP